MPKYDLKITVTEVRGGGTCDMGIKIGDSWKAEEGRAPFCTWAYSAIFPFISAMRYGAKFPWEPNAEVAFACCPDPHNTVVFKIERLGEIEN